MWFSVSCHNFILTVETKCILENLHKAAIELTFPLTKWQTIIPNPSWHSIIAILTKIFFGNLMPHRRQRLQTIPTPTSLLANVCAVKCLRNSLLLLTFTTRVWRAHDRSKFSKIFRNLNFHCYIWIQHEKCIKMSTNKPSIGWIILIIAPLTWENFINFNLHIPRLYPTYKAFMLYTSAPVLCQKKLKNLKLFSLNQEQSQEPLHQY